MDCSVRPAQTSWLFYIPAAMTNCHSIFTATTGQVADVHRLDRPWEPGEGSYNVRPSCTKLSGGTPPRISPHFRGPRDSFPRAKAPREKGIVTVLVVSA